MYEYEPATYFASLRPLGQTPAQYQSWRRMAALRAFVLLSGESLVSERAEGHGEHVDALAYLLGVEPAQRGEAVARWRASYLASDTAVEFSSALVAELPSRS
jgi:hypothetical protein